MGAHFAVPILGIVVGAREQFTGTRRLDDVGRAVGPHLRALGVEWHEEVQLLASVRVRHREQCGIGDVEVGLIE